MKGGSSSGLYWLLSLIILFSFFHFSFYFSPLLNSDSALGVLMGTYLDLPRDLYCWGQDRGGNFTPLISGLLTSITSLPIIISISFIHYGILTLGAFSYAFFIRNTTLKIIFFILWFLPPWQFVEFLLYPYGLQYSILGILLYLLFRYPEAPSNKRLILSALIAIIAMIGIWVSDFLALSLVALLFTTFYLKRDFFIQRKNIISILLWTVCCATFIIYGKLQATHSQSYSTITINSITEILSATGIVWQSIKRIFLFQSESIFQSIFWWLIVVTLTLNVNRLRQIIFTQKSESRQFLILLFFLNTLLTLAALFSTKWVLDNEMGRRYFSTLYISSVLLIIYLLDEKSVFNRRSRLILILLTTISSISAIENFYFPRMRKSKISYVRDVTTLAPAGIIGDYWNSYVYSSLDPMQLISTPHDRSVYRNIALTEKVFNQPRIYLVKDMWLQNFPDTVRQFGRILIKQGKMFHLGDSDFCQYQVDSTYYHFSYRPMIPSKQLIAQKLLNETIINIGDFKFNGYSSFDSLSPLRQAIKLADFNDATHTTSARTNILLKGGQQTITLSLRRGSVSNTTGNIICRIKMIDGNQEDHTIPVSELSSDTYTKIPIKIISDKKEEPISIELLGSSTKVLCDQMLISDQ